MAWTRVKLQGHLSESSNQSGERTARLVFIAVSNTPTDASAAETANDGTTVIPLRGSSYPGEVTRLAKSIQVKPDPEAPSTVFVVTVDYSSAVNSNQQAADPLARPDVVSFDSSTEKTKFFLSEDATPKPIVNSAGEPFEEFQECDTGVFKLVIEGNRASINAATYATYLYPKTATNNASITVRGLALAIGTARIVNISATPTTENNVEFLRVRWELHVASTHDLNIQDRGFQEKGASLGIFKTIVTSPTDPKPVDTPWPLDGSGVKKALSTDAPAVLTFKRYPQKNFGYFGWTA